MSIYSTAVRKLLYYCHTKLTELWTICIEFQWRVTGSSFLRICFTHLINANALPCPLLPLPNIFCVSLYIVNSGVQLIPKSLMSYGIPHWRIQRTCRFLCTIPHSTNTARCLFMAFSIFRQLLLEKYQLLTLMTLTVDRYQCLLQLEDLEIMYEVL